MPIYKAFILNKEINVNYEDNQKKELEEAINAINVKLKNYDDQNGKISDSKLLSFLAINLQAELLELNKAKIDHTILKKKINDSNYENINLNDQLYELREQNTELRKENKLINQELDNIQNQIELIINLIKSNYEE